MGAARYRRFVASAAVKIARTQPLLANGSNLRGVPGRKLRAAGRLMTLIPAGARPSYRWTVLSKPRRSHVSLANPRSLTTVLRPNRPGVYRLRLTARIGKQTAVDDLTDATTANYPPLGTLVNTMADDGQAIQVGSQVYNFTDPPNGACNALNVVVLDRRIPVEPGRQLDRRRADPAAVDPLFAPYAYSSGVITQFGLYKPWFYREAYRNVNLPQVSNCGGA